MFFYTFIPRLLNMSLTASVAIVFVLLLRLLLKKAPKVIAYALWSVVLFRLLCPVSIESNLSLFGLLDAPTSETSTLTSTIAYVPSDIVHTEFPAVVLPVPGVSNAINEVLPQGREQLAADPLEAPMAIATYIWMAGVLVMVVYSAVSYLRLRQKLMMAARLRDNIYLVDEISSPFVMGLFRPKIYLPSAIGEQEQSYILLHEQHHIRRLDHIAKALAFVALCIHWFNPLVWLAFILSGKDMEMSCDEAVVKKMGDGVLADYTASLLSLATGKRIIAGMPLAFGEGDTKSRIRNLANWRKPTFWVILLAVIACAVLAVCLLTNPVNGNTPDYTDDGYFLVIGTEGVQSIEVSTPNRSGGVVNADGSAFKLGEKVYLEQLDGVTDLRGVSITALSADGEILYAFSVPEGASDAEMINLVGADGWLLAPTSFSMAGGVSGPERGTVRELIPGTTYVSYQRIYMNPLSSYAAFGGDSGCKYIVGEDYFATINRNDGSIISLEGHPNLDTSGSGLQNMVDVPKWEWQEFPYTDEEWAALYIPEGFGMQNIGEIFDEILYQPLTAGRFLLRVDGDLWLVELSSNPQMGTYLWSIYSLVPESAMGMAQWEFVPMFSSRSPVFRFEFDMDYTEVSAACVDGLLVDWETTGAPSDHSMTFQKGVPLYWSPQDEDEIRVNKAMIHFTVLDGEAAPYHGTIYIEGTGDNTKGRTIYTARLVGAGLHLEPNAEQEGGIITAVADVVVPTQTVEHDLTISDLEATADEIGQYIFYTNSEQIAVEVKSDSDFDGTITLVDISQGNAEIQHARVNGDDNDAIFTGLTASRRYRLDCEGLEGCTLVISG